MDGNLASHLAEAAVAMAGQHGLDATLDSICSYAVSSVGADACGIFLVQGRRVKMAATSDPALVESERVQMETRQGPCLETIWQAQTYVVADMARDERWPRWAARMGELGWRSSLSVRLSEGERTLGSLNLYSRRVDGFGDREQRAGVIFARHASIALSAARAEESLREAVVARHSIGAAQGILMERYRVGLTAAFETLRRHSQDTHTKLHTVASYVIEHRELPETGADG